MRYPLPPELPARSPAGPAALPAASRWPSPSRGSGPGRRRKAPLGAGTAATAGGTGRGAHLREPGHAQVTAQGGAAARANGTAPRPSRPRSLETLGNPAATAAPATWPGLEGECHQRDIACPGCTEPRNSPAAPGAGCAAASRPKEPPNRGQPAPSDAAMLRWQGRDTATVAGPTACRSPAPGERRTHRAGAPARGTAERGAAAERPGSSLSAARRDAHPSSLIPLPSAGPGGRLPRRSHQLRFPLRYLSQDGMTSPPAAEALSQCNKCPPGRGGRRRRGGGRGAAAQRSGRPGCHSPRRAPGAAASPPPPARARPRALLGCRGRRTAGRYHQVHGGE